MLNKMAVLRKAHSSSPFAMMIILLFCSPVSTISTGTSIYIIFMIAIIFTCTDRKKCRRTHLVLLFPLMQACYFSLSVLRSFLFFNILRNNVQKNRCGGGKCNKNIQEIPEYSFICNCRSASLNPLVSSAYRLKFIWTRTKCSQTERRSAIL